MKFSSQRLTLIGIFVLFLAPVILVMLMQSRWWQYQPGGLKNHGQLVQPPVRLSLKATGNGIDTSANRGIEDKWLLLYVLSDPCDQACSQNIAALRQIHKATGRHQQHLAIAIFCKHVPDPELQSRLESIYSQLNFVTDSSATAPSTLELINAGLASAEGQAVNFQTYILDPMHNVILAFEDDADPRNIHKDLKRLLKWSAQED